MSATLTIDRSDLSLAPLVIGEDDSTGFTLAPGLSIGTVTWRKNTADAPSVPGRTMTAYTRDTAAVVGGVNCFGGDPQELQDRITEIITALTQVTGTGFQQFGMTYAHISGIVTATYSWTCTEPADITPGNAPDGTLDDAQMASLIQTVGFTVVRNPIATAGPI